MASLKPGVLVKLLEDMNNGDMKECGDDRKPVMLQIRSIIPVLEEGDLWPNKGFYLKVSDLTHAIYVSLPQEQNEMIMNNQLKLGQCIYVQKLEASHPAPILWGITPTASRRPCEGVPEEILPANNLVKFLEASVGESIVEKGVISEKKISNFSSNPRKLSRGSSDSEVMADVTSRLCGENQAKRRSLSASKSRPSEPVLGLNYVTKRCDVGKKLFDVFEDMQKTKSSVNNDSDSDNSTSTVSSTQLSISKRRSWTESEILEVKDIFDSSVVKREMRPVARPRSRSTHASPVRSVRYDSSDEGSICLRSRKDISSAKKLVKTPNKSTSTVVKKSCKEISYPMVCSAVDDFKQAENRVSWDSLPSDLVKLGKEVIKQRDVAIQAAIEALQEACAAQRLIRCLSTYSECQSPEEDDLQPFVDKFFNLQDDLGRTRLITQSLTNISLDRTSLDIDHSSTGTVKEVLTLAQERNKNAASWIKSAVAVDISPLSESLKPPPSNTIAVPNGRTKKSKIANVDSTKPKGVCIVKKQKKNDDYPLSFAADKEDQQGWGRRNTAMGPTIDLAAALQDDCRRWFMNHVEKYLDEVETKVAVMESDSKRAAMMYNIKRVSDWLGKEAGSPNPECRESCTLNESEMESCQRVRNKIYGILMKHVERTAMALEAL